MSCISQLLQLKGDKPFLPIRDGNEVVIEGGGVYKDYEYLITFTHSGHRCGYVALHDNDSDSYSDIHCHGGITFADERHSAKNLLPIACNDFWIGFDCAHYGDTPNLTTAREYFGGNSLPDDIIASLLDLHKACTYSKHRDIDFLHKTYEFVEKECHSIIDQLVTKKAA